MARTRTIGPGLVYCEDGSLHVNLDILRQVFGVTKEQLPDEELAWKLKEICLDLWGVNVPIEVR